jgi:hypothetical protein
MSWFTCMLGTRECWARMKKCGKSHNSSCRETEQCWHPSKVCDTNEAYDVMCDGLNPTTELTRLITLMYATQSSMISVRVRLLRTSSLTAQAGAGLLSAAARLEHSGSGDRDDAIRGTSASNRINSWPVLSLYAFCASV